MRTHVCRIDRDLSRGNGSPRGLLVVMSDDARCHYYDWRDGEEPDP